MSEDILANVAAAVPDIRATLRDTYATDRDGGVTNPSGDHTVAADVAVDETLLDRLRNCDDVGTYASEERESPIDCGSGYAVTVDPIDGSSNLRSNNAVGTVLGIYDAPLPAQGRDLVASVLVLYGPLTTMTAARDGDVTTWRIESGERVDPEPVTLPSHPGICGSSDADGELMSAFTALRDDPDLAFTRRYTGAMVADVAQLLSAGGVICYPGLPTDADAPLRLQYEANPVAHLVTTAGGVASDGTTPMLEREPTGLHERVPTFLGNRTYVDRVTAGWLRGADR